MRASLVLCVLAGALLVLGLLCLLRSGPADAPFRLELRRVGPGGGFDPSGTLRLELRRIGPDDGYYQIGKPLEFDLVIRNGSDVPAAVAPTPQGEIGSDANPRATVTLEVSDDGGHWRRPEERPPIPICGTFGYGPLSGAQELPAGGELELVRESALGRSILREEQKLRVWAEYFFVEDEPRWPGVPSLRLESEPVIFEVLPSPIRLEPIVHGPVRPGEEMLLSEVLALRLRNASPLPFQVPRDLYSGVRYEVQPEEDRASLIFEKSPPQSWSREPLVPPQDCVDLLELAKTSGIECRIRARTNPLTVRFVCDYGAAELRSPWTELPLAE